MASHATLGVRRDGDLQLLLIDEVAVSAARGGGFAVRPTLWCPGEGNFSSDPQNMVHGEEDSQAPGRLCLLEGRVIIQDSL